ncbi:MAG: autotransporter-associated beta strand repeat-containing protein, partial [Alphaproteobacteria bacterium]|nr:autotransporter-associated beta strand repeat-containing protein [Alphaproteobacteria bacterium]
MQPATSATFRRRLLGSTALLGAAAIGIAVALQADPAAAACNIVPGGGDLTGQSNVTVVCDATEATQQGDGTNNSVVFTVGGGASLDTGSDPALSLNNNNTITVNGAIRSSSNLYGVSLGGIGNMLTVNGDGSIVTDSDLLGAVRVVNSGGDVSGNTFTVNAGGRIQGYTDGIYLRAFSPYLIRNNVVTINRGATVTAGSVGLYFAGDSQGNLITVNGSLLQTTGCGCANAIRFAGDATGNTIVVGGTGLVSSAQGAAIFFSSAASNNVITVNAGGQIRGVTYGIYFATTGTGNTLTVNGTVQATGAGSHGIYVRNDANNNTITIGPGGLVSGAASGITLGIVENSNTITNSGTVIGDVGINLVSGSGANTNTVINNAGGLVRGTGGTAFDASQDNNGGRFFVENSGTIDGNVVFGLGDDRLTLFPGQSLIGTINGLAGNDQLVLHGTGNAVFANTIVNNSFETLVKQGDSIWTLGASQTFTGGTTVNAGALLLGAGTTLTSDVTVNGGAFGGNGTLNGGLTLNGGTLSPGASIGTLVVAGNADLSNGTTLIEVDRASSDRLVAGGA